MAYTTAYTTVQAVIIQIVYIRYICDAADFSQWQTARPTGCNRTVNRRTDYVNGVPHKNNS